MATDVTKCPLCFGQVEVGARKCKHCGEWIGLAESRQQLAEITQHLAESRQRTAGTVQRVAIDPKHVAAGIAEYETNKTTGGCLVGLVLMAAGVVGVLIHWTAGVGLLLLAAVWVFGRK